MARKVQPMVIRRESAVVSLPSSDELPEMEGAEDYNNDLMYWWDRVRSALMLGLDGNLETVESRLAVIEAKLASMDTPAGPTLLSEHVTPLAPDSLDGVEL